MVQWTVPSSNTTTARVRVTATDVAGNSASDESDADFTISSTIDVPLAALPTEFALRQNVPNPLTSQTTIRFALPEQSRVSLTIYDASGRRIRSLVNGVLPPSEQSVVWNGRDESGSRVRPGIYFARFQANGFSATKRMVVTK